MAEDVMTGQLISEMMSGAHIMEISGDGESINVPIDPKIDVTALTMDDPSPMFVNVETLRTGVSRVNRRYFNNDVVRQVSSMTPGVQGCLGHPDPSKVGFEFREPHTLFVGSMVQELQDGSGGLKSIAKAYIFKSSPLREWIPKSIAAGNPLTVSINGIGDIARDSVNNIIHVRSMNQLDSIDWANPGTQGVSTAQALSVVSEMQKGGNNMEAIVKTPEVIKSISIQELKAFNTDAVNGIIGGITIQELQNGNPNLYKQVIESAKITEMNLTIDGKEQTVKLDAVQGIIDAANSKVTEMQNRIDADKLEVYKAKKLASDVPEIIREQVAKRIVGKTEAEIDASITNEVAYIKEISGGRIEMPRGNGEKKLEGDELKGAVKKMFGVKEKK